MSIPHRRDVLKKARVSVSRTPPPTQRKLCKICCPLRGLFGRSLVAFGHDAQIGLGGCGGSYGRSMHFVHKENRDLSEGN